jgi:DNA-binding NtrC family response regulator
MRMYIIQKLIDNKQFKWALDAAEKEIFLAAYHETRNNQSAAAELLGVSRGTFISRLKEWQVLPKGEFGNE